MSGLVVRPGDTLVWPVQPPSDVGTDARMKMKEFIEADLPGVTVMIVEGMAGGPFVYRPDPACTHEEWEQRLSEAMSIVDNPVTGEPLGYVRDTTECLDCGGTVIDGVCEHSREAKS